MACNSLMMTQIISGGLEENASRGKALRNQVNGAFGCYDDNGYYKIGIIWCLVLIILENITGKKKLKFTNAQKGTGLKSESPCSSFKGVPYLYPQSRYGQRSSTKPEYKGLRVATPDKWVTLTCLLSQGKGTIGEGAEPWDMGWKHGEDKIRLRTLSPKISRTFPTNRSRSEPSGREESTFSYYHQGQLTDKKMRIPLRTYPNNPHCLQVHMKVRFQRSLVIVE